MTLQESDPVVLLQSSQYGSYNGAWLDPSGAATDDVIMAAFNGPTVASIDGGATFPWTLNPTAIFPNNVDGGLCCNQVIHYVPQIDCFVWLMRFKRGLLPGDPPDDPKGPT